MRIGRSFLCQLGPDLDRGRPTTARWLWRGEGPSPSRRPSHGSPPARSRARISAVSPSRRRDLQQDAACSRETSTTTAPRSPIASTELLMRFDNILLNPTAGSARKVRRTTTRACCRCRCPCGTGTAGASRDQKGSTWLETRWTAVRRSVSQISDIDRTEAVMSRFLSIRSLAMSLMRSAALRMMEALLSAAGEVLS